MNKKRFIREMSSCSIPFGLLSTKDQDAFRDVVRDVREIGEDEAGARVKRFTANGWIPLTSNILKADQTYRLEPVRLEGETVRVRKCKKCGEEPYFEHTGWGEDSEGYFACGNCNNSAPEGDSVEKAASLWNMINSNLDQFQDVIRVTNSEPEVINGLAFCLKCSCTLEDCECGESDEDDEDEDW